MLVGFACRKSKTAKIFETTQNYPEELQQLHKNALTNILANSVDTEKVKQLLADIKEDGTWATIDYTSKQRGGWPTNVHLSNLLEIAKAYQKVETKFYQQKYVSEKMHLALNFWLENDFICPNWWYPVIGVPMQLNPILLLMEPELSDEQLQKAIPILKRCKIGRTGQNKVWQSGNVLFTSLLMRNVEMVKKASASIQEELVVSNGEGVQPDWSYHQHGPQLQFGNYGLSYVGDMIKWVSILRQTPYHFNESKVTILRNYLLEGLQWVTWKNQMDISACGRQLFPDSPAEKASRLSQFIKQMETLDPKFAADYSKANDSKNLSGNKHFWRSDFHVKRSPKYYFSVKMNSERVIGAESCNSENVQGYYMGDGAAFLYQSGEEYRNIFPFWDWKKIPGTTTQQNNEILPVLTASGYRIKSDFVGGLVGVSIGKFPANSVAAMVYDRNGLQARKAWFMFDDMIVCLGNGISSQSQWPVTTSINQVFRNKLSAVKTNSGKEWEESNNLKKSDWFLHDSLGYFFPEGGNVHLETKSVKGAWNWVANRYPEIIDSSQIVKLWIDHGISPKDEAYEYVLVPNATETKMNEMEKKFPLKIINEKDRQEVVSAQGWSTVIVFYKPGKSEALGGIEVNKPCILILDELMGATNIRITDPTRKLDEIKLTLNDSAWTDKKIVVENGKSVVNIEFPRSENLDKTMQFTIHKK